MHYCFGFSLVFFPRIKSSVQYGEPGQCLRLTVNTWEGDIRVPSMMQSSKTWLERMREDSSNGE